MIQGKCTAVGILLITLVQGKQHLILMGQVELLYDWFPGFGMVSWQTWPADPGVGICIRKYTNSGRAPKILKSQNIVQLV